jgi:branched-chain amino acid transport system substrate-binding protein
MLMTTRRLPTNRAVLTLLTTVGLSAGWAGAAAATTEPPGTEPADSESAGTDICAAADAGPISIVHLTDIPGESPTAVDDFWNGSQLAVAEINELCGSEVVTIERVPAPIQADAFEPRLLEAQEMEPTAMIGGPSSSLLALNPVVDEGGIPMIWPVGTAAGLSDNENFSEWAWMARAVNDSQGEVVGTWLSENGFSNIWLECVETPFGENGCDNAAAAIEGAGGTVAGRRSHATDASDFTSSIVDLQAAEADAVALFTFPAPQITFLNQLEENGGLDIRVVGGASSELIYLAHSAAQQEALVAIADCNPPTDDPDVAAAYLEAYEKPMIGLSAITYDSVYLVVDAVARMGSTEPDAVAEGIASTAWDGVCQDYFDSGSHALAHHMVITSFGEDGITTEATIELNERGDQMG